MLLIKWKSRGISIVWCPWGRMSRWRWITEQIFRLTSFWKRDADDTFEEFHVRIGEKHEKLYKAWYKFIWYIHFWFQKWHKSNEKCVRSIRSKQTIYVLSYRIVTNMIPKSSFSFSTTVGVCDAQNRRGIDKEGYIKRILYF